jgi:hypothetical protein
VQAVQGKPADRSGTGVGRGIPFKHEIGIPLHFA